MSFKIEMHKNILLLKENDKQSLIVLKLLILLNYTSKKIGGVITRGLFVS